MKDGKRFKAVNITKMKIFCTLLKKTSNFCNSFTFLFSKECKQAIRLQLTALRKFNTEPTTSNLISFKFHRTNARKIIKEAKKKSWKNYVSKLNTTSNTKTVWLMIRKIAGKKQSTPLKHLSVTNHKITGKKAIEDLLAETFSKNFSSQFQTEFYKVKHSLEKKKNKFFFK